MSQSASDQRVSFLGIVIWSLAALFFLYEYFLRTFVGSISHQVMPDLHLDAKQFAFVGSIYYIAYGLMQLPVGVLAQKFGVKKNMVFAVIICAVASILFAHATGYQDALLSRFLMGFGSAFAFICLLVISLSWFPSRYFGFISGLSQFVGTMGPLIAGGPLVAVLQHSGMSWRTAMFYVGLFGLFLAALIVTFVRRKNRSDQQELIHLERKEPLMVSMRRLMRNPQAWYVSLFSATVYVSLALLGAIWGTEYLMVSGLSQSRAASMISLAWLGFGIGCPLWGGLSDWVARRRPFMVLCAMLGLLATTGITYGHFAHSAWMYGVLFFALGIAASGQNLCYAAITEHTAKAVHSPALGMNNGMVTVFGAILPPFVGYLISSAAGAGVTHFQPEHFRHAFIVMPILNVVALFIAMYLIEETYCKPRKGYIKLRSVVRELVDA